MAIGELLIESGRVGLEALIDRYKRWRDESFFEELEPAAQTAFLEVVVAAIVHDGKKAYNEERWLERRTDDSAMVEAALEVALAALPGDAGEDEYRAFVAARAEKLDSQARERAFANAAALLIASHAETSVDAALVFGDALGIEKGTATAEIETLRGGL